MHPLNTIYTISVISPSAYKTNTVHTEFCSKIFSGLHHLFWPRYYYSIIKTKEKRRYIWEILKNPEPPNGPKSDKRVVTLWQLGGAYHLMRNTIVCLNQNMHCHSHYQVQGAYAHLN